MNLSQFKVRYEKLESPMKNLPSKSHQNLIELIVLSNLDIDDETILFTRVDEKHFQIIKTYQILFYFDTSRTKPAFSSQSKIN